MHEFNDKIAAWRQTMAADFSGREEALDELESHLRDALDSLVKIGRPSDEAWRLALVQLGTTRQLAGEFRKLPPVATSWLPVRVIGVGGLVLSACLAGLLIPRLATSDGVLVTHTLLVALGYSSTLLVGALAGCYLVSRLFQDLETGKVRSLRRALTAFSALGAGLTAAGVLLGGVWLLRHADKFWEWDPREVGGLTIFLWNVAMLAVLRQAPGRGFTALMVVAMFGNVLVILGWFGAVALATPRYGLVGGWMTIWALAAAQLAVGGLALAPARCLRMRRE
jgi:hypothetical protein